MKRSRRNDDEEEVEEEEKRRGWQEKVCVVEEMDDHFPLGKLGLFSLFSC